LSVGYTVPIQLLLVLRVGELATDPAPVVGLVIGVGAAVSLVTSPIAGRVTDVVGARFGRRRTWVAFGSVSAGLALAALGLADQLWQVFVLWCLVQLLSNFQAAATDGMFADQAVGARQGRTSGLAGLSTLLGPLLGLGLAGVFPAGSAGQWYAIAAVTVLFGLVTVFLVRDTPAAPREHRSSAPALWIRPFRARTFRAAWILRFLATCSIATVLLGGAYVVQRFDMDTEESAGAITRLLLVSTVVAVVSGVAAGYWTDRRREQKPTLVVSGILCAVGAMSVALAPTFSLVLVGVVVHAVGIGAFIAVDFALCARLLPDPEHAGKDMAIFGLASAIPQAIVPLALPVLLPLGGFTLFYSVFAVLGLVALLTLRAIPEIGAEPASPESPESAVPGSVGADGR